MRTTGAVRAAVRTAASSGRAAGIDVRVVTYNVLSSDLSSPTSPHLCTRPPSDLDPELRYKRLVARLESEIEQGAVVCLQEVSSKWASRLLPFFASKQYMYVHQGYGNFFGQDSMGVGVAYAMSTFELVDTRLSRVALAKKWPRAPPPSWLQSAWDMATAVPIGAWQGAKGRLRRVTPRPVASAVRDVWHRLRSCLRTGGGGGVDALPFGGNRGTDIWQAAQRRQNRATLVRLRHVSARQEFVVGTYHMPCAFRTPDMMVIHAALVAQLVLSFANGAPAILAGDFNFKPIDGCYQLVTTGSLPDSHPHYPTPPAWETWRPDLSEAFTSLYAAASRDGKTEPAFTNAVKFKGGDDFVDTLDYIFLAGGATAVSCDPLPDLATCGYLPSSDHPSDHLAIAGTVHIPSRL